MYVLVIQAEKMFQPLKWKKEKEAIVHRLLDFTANLILLVRGVFIQPLLYSQLAQDSQGSSSILERQVGVECDKTRVNQAVPYEIGS